MSVPRLQLIDAETLLATPLPKTMYIVDNLLPQGLSIFCGASKIGKSWLMLDLAIKVAKGEPMWGLATHQCDVLYLTLEDTIIRVQERLYKLVDEAPVNLRIAVACEKIGKGLEEQINAALNEYSNIKLIIIDTFQKVRNAGGSVRDGMYAVDYADVSALKEIADKNKIAVMFVHHLRKVKDLDDPFNDVSGSTGIAGAADTILIMSRARNEKNANLIVSGRDINYQEILLNFENFNWSLDHIKTSSEIQKEQVPDFILKLCDFLSQQIEWSGTATELIAAMGDTETTPNLVTKYLGRFAEKYLAPIGIKYTTKKSGKRYIFFKKVK